MISVLSKIDFDLIKWATHLTSIHPTFQIFVYIAAEVLIFVLPLFLYYLWRRPELRSRQHGAQKAVVMACMSLVLALAAKTLLSFILVRARPFVSHPELYVMSFKVDSQSFPSAHTLIAFSLAFSVWFSDYRKIAGWMLIVASLIAFGRFFSGVHYLSDVLAGIIIAWVSAFYLHREASTLKQYLPNE